MLGWLGLATVAFAAAAPVPVHGQAQLSKVAPTAAAQRVLITLNPNEVASLRGLRADSIAVIGEAVSDSLVEKSVADSAAIAVGLTSAQVESLTVAALRGSDLRVKVLPTQQRLWYGPFLKVKVEFGPGTAAKGPYVGFVKVALTQMVARVRDIPFVKSVGRTASGSDLWQLGQLDVAKLMFAETWHSQAVFNTSSKPIIAQTVKQVVAQWYLSDYRRANLPAPPGAHVGGGRE